MSQKALFAECRNGKRRYAECRYAACRGAVKVIILKKCLIVVLLPQYHDSYNERRDKYFFGFQFK